MIRKPFYAIGTIKYILFYCKIENHILKKFIYILFYFTKSIDGI